MLGLLLISVNNILLSLFFWTFLCYFWYLLSFTCSIWDVFLKINSSFYFYLPLLSILWGFYLKILLYFIFLMFCFNIITEFDAFYFVNSLGFLYLGLWWESLTRYCDCEEVSLIYLNYLESFVFRSYLNFEWAVSLWRTIEFDLFSHILDNDTLCPEFFNYFILILLYLFPSFYLFFVWYILL